MQKYGVEKREKNKKKKKNRRRFCVRRASTLGRFWGKRHARYAGLATRLLRKWNLVVNGTEGNTFAYRLALMCQHAGIHEPRVARLKKLLWQCKQCVLAFSARANWKYTCTLLCTDKRSHEWENDLVLIHKSRQGLGVTLTPKTIRGSVQISKDNREEFTIWRKSSRRTSIDELDHSINDINLLRWTLFSVLSVFKCNPGNNKWQVHCFLIISMIIQWCHTDEFKRKRKRRTIVYRYRSLVMVREPVAKRKGLKKTKRLGI